VNIRYADVIYTFVEEIYPSGYKFLVCINEELDYFLLINSLNREIYECVEISVGEYRFLKYDSFVSCSRFFKLAQESLVISKIVGRINLEDMQRIYDKIQISNKWLTRQKTQIKSPT